MYTVGLDVDKLVFTKKILLYAGNSCISSPLVFFTLGTIYFLSLSGQSAGNFGFSTITTVVTKNTYNKYINLPKISEHISNHRSNLNDNQLGYLLAGLIEGNGWFGKKVLHIIFAENDKSFAYYIKKRIGFGNIYKFKNKKVVLYICKHTKGLHYIVSLINGKFVTNHKYDQLIKYNYSEDFNIKLLPPLKKLSLDNY
jgi:hypothetical protein